MKYVMFSVARPPRGEDVRYVPVIFPDELVHDDVARALHRCLEHHFPRCKVLADSAGEIVDLEISCRGESESLKLVSKPERDTRIINTYDYTHGMVL